MQSFFVYMYILPSGVGPGWGATPPPSEALLNPGAGVFNVDLLMGKKSASINFTFTHTVSPQQHLHMSPPLLYAMDRPEKKGLKRSIFSDPNGTTRARKRLRDDTGTHVDTTQYMLEEIRALGGDDGDLHLVAEPGSSESEELGDETACYDQALETELTRMAQELGFKTPHRGPKLMAPSKHAEDKASPTSRSLTSPSEVPQSKKDGLVSGISRPFLEVSFSNIPNRFLQIFPPRPDWHAVSLCATSITATSSRMNASSTNVDELLSHARMLLDAEAERYKPGLSTSSRRFLSTIMSSGTLSDKVSALTLTVQESPVHNIKAFEALLSLASKKSRTQALGALGALVDLLGSGSVLPPDRRLRPFSGQPGLQSALRHGGKSYSWRSGTPLPGDISTTHLIMWAYEDWLKEAYFRVVQILEVWCLDEIEHSRMKGVDFVYRLLKEKPEQETNLLRLLVNKLKDRERRVASRVSYLLLQLQNCHPGMKPVVIHAIEKDLLLDPGLHIRATYFAVNTLNQTILSAAQPGTAKALIRIYFAVFVDLLNTDQLSSGTSVDNTQTPSRKVDGKNTQPPPVEAVDKLVSAVLTGINRAIPFVDADDGQ